MISGQARGANFQGNLSSLECPVRALSRGESVRERPFLAEAQCLGESGVFFVVFEGFKVHDTLPEANSQGSEFQQFS